MATRDIRTHTTVTGCDVCGRTLLRGERSEVYVSGGDRKNVCELCKSRALHEGWLREGTVPDYAENGNPREHRGSFLRLLRGGRRTSPAPERPVRARPVRGRPPAPDRSSAEEVDEAPVQAIRFDEPRPRTRAGEPEDARRFEGREPRHVRAVPTSVEQKSLAAIELFNGSEHRRTIAGVARSLGAPWVSVRAAAGHSSIVALTVSWELCWYRYEVDLADELPHVRSVGQGYELNDLEETERVANAMADEQGELHPA